MLLGVKELCKITSSTDLEHIVNKYAIPFRMLDMLVDEMCDDDSFDNLIEGELYEDLLNIQLWYEKSKENPILDTSSIYENIIKENVELISRLEFLDD
jgi:hypothetical protein